MPKQAAASATANSTSDGRSRLIAATSNAAMPNAEWVNSAIAIPRVKHSQVSRLAVQASPTVDCSMAR